jgi:hypothetical protein
MSKFFDVAPALVQGLRTRMGVEAESRRGDGAAAPAGDQEAIPPVGITGGKVTAEGLSAVQHSVKLDWLNVVFPDAVRDQVLELVTARLGGGTELEHGVHTYTAMCTWETGAFLAWSPGRPECLLSLNGDSCDQYVLEELLAFLKACSDLGGRGTRVDLAFDDYTQQLVNLALIHQAADEGNFCGFKVHEPRQEKTRRGELLSDAHCFGRKGKAGSGRQVVVYNKALESKGQIISNRLEARFFKEAAELVFASLVECGAGEHLEAQMRVTIGGAIDFRDRQGVHKHKDRMPRLAWWQSILDVLGEASFVVHHNKPPLQRALEYCRDTWAASFALLFELAESAGQDGDAIVTTFAKLMVDQGKVKIEKGWRPGARDLGIDLVELLSAS